MFHTRGTSQRRIFWCTFTTGKDDLRANGHLLAAMSAPCPTRQSRPLYCRATLCSKPFLSLPSATESWWKLASHNSWQWPIWRANSTKVAIPEIACRVPFCISSKLSGHLRRLRRLRNRHTKQQGMPTRHGHSRARRPRAAARTSCCDRRRHPPSLAFTFTFTFTFGCAWSHGNAPAMHALGRVEADFETRGDHVGVS